MTGRSAPLARIPGLLALAEVQLGLVSRAQLADLGVTRNHVRRQIEAQRWQRAGPRVLALMTGALDADQQRWAAVLHGGDRCVLSGMTSLQVHGLEGWIEDRVHVLVPHGVKVPALDGVAVHRARDFDQVPVVRRGGLPCTSAARAVLDGGSAQPGTRAAAGLVIGAVRQRLLTPDQVLAELDVSGLRRHAAAMRQAARDAAGGVEAVSEVDVTRLLVRAGLSAFRRQEVISTVEGYRRVDVLVDLPDGTQLVVEVDGPRHDHPDVRAVDALKDAAAIAAGYAVLRLPLALVRHQPARVVAQLVSLRRAAEARVGGRNAS